MSYLVGPCHGALDRHVPSQRQGLWGSGFPKNEVQEVFDTWGTRDGQRGSSCSTGVTTTRDIGVYDLGIGIFRQWNLIKAYLGTNKWHYIELLHDILPSGWYPQCPSVHGYSDTFRISGAQPKPNPAQWPNRPSLYELPSKSIIYARRLVQKYKLSVLEGGLSLYSVLFKSTLNNAQKYSGIGFADSDL